MVDLWPMAAFNYKNPSTMTFIFIDLESSHKDLPKRFKMTQRTPPHHQQHHHPEQRPEQSPEQGREQSPDDRDRKDHTDPSSERNQDLTNNKGEHAMLKGYLGDNNVTCIHNGCNDKAKTVIQTAQTENRMDGKTYECSNIWMIYGDILPEA